MITAPMRSTPPSAGVDLAVVAVVALGARLVFCFLLYGNVVPALGPGDGYDVIARNLVEGNGYVLAGRPAAAERLPLYPLFLAASVRLFGPSPWPWQLVQCIAGAATCALVFSLARRHASRAAALAAGGLCALHPALILYTARPFTETLYTLLLVLLVRALLAPAWRARSVGALLGLQLLTKSTAVLQAATLILAAARGRVGAALRAAGVALLVMVPWVAWNLTTSGAPHLLTATAGRALYHGLYISRHVSWSTPSHVLNMEAQRALARDLARQGVPATAGVAEQDNVAGQLARAWIADHPRETIGLWSRNLVLTWFLGRSRTSMTAYWLLHGPLLAAAAIGAVRLWRRRPEARELVLLCTTLIVAYTAAHALHPAVRYVLPVVPLTAVLAAGAAPREGAYPKRVGTAFQTSNVCSASR